jgi:CubicO group peptidase (beta-lactamase class C family)
MVSEALATAANWQMAPYNRWAFQNVRAVLPTVIVSRDPALVRPFVSSLQDLGSLPCPTVGQTPTALTDVLSQTYVDGFLVLQNGNVLFEQYFNGLQPTSTHIIMSVSKSMIGSLIGILESRGVLDLDQPCRFYVPELLHSDYGAVTLRALLDMRSRMRYSEDYSDPNAEFFDFDAACGLRPLRQANSIVGMHTYLAAMKSDPHDSGDFQYRSTDSDVLGWVAERAMGQPLQQLLSECLWRPMGAETNADLMTDAFGAPLADGGLCVTLRDLARFGECQRNYGRVGERSVIPSEWVAATCAGDRGTFAKSHQGSVFQKGAYSRQWWAVDSERGVQMALGIHGQTIYIDRPNRLVCVQLASQPEPFNLEHLLSTLSVCRTLSRELRPAP